MKNLITTKTKGTMSGDVFFGTASIFLDATHRVHRFNVCSHLDGGDPGAGNEAHFRSVVKVKAGWLTVCEFDSEPTRLWERIGKNTHCVQVEIKKGVWMDVYNLKGGLWANIDVVLLDTCTVSDIRTSCNKMASNEAWKAAKATNWADKAFVINK